MKFSLTHLKKIFALALVGTTLWPTLSHGQTGSQTVGPDSLLDAGQITISEQDKVLLSKDPASFDYRLITTILPYLASPEGGNLGDLQVGRIRWGYDTEATKQTRKTAGDNTSPHFYGKAASITAIGTTYCGKSSLFPQNIDVPQPIWTNWQTGEQDDRAVRWPFGMSFDRVAGELFWDQAKSFTGRPVNPQSWSDFLTTVAKAEIEQRLNLAPGDLQGIGINDLPSGLAELRLARTLGISEIPNASTEQEFYEQIGRRLIETDLNLPRYSLAAQPTWRELYQQVAITSLERELDLTPSLAEQRSITFNDQFVESTRFQNLANALRSRATYYQDPVLALGLPSNEYLPADSGSSILERVASGDPDGLSIAGAYFLAQYLELSGTDTKQIIGQLNATTDDLPLPLRSARPLNPDYQAEDLFVTTPKDQSDIYEEIGRTQRRIIEANLERLDESALLAMSGGNKTPTLNTVLGVLLNQSKREAALKTIAKTIAYEANYTELTNEALVDRGRELFAKGLDLPIDQLKSAENDRETAAAIGPNIDSLMSWPSEQHVTESLLAAGENSASLGREMRTIGAAQLWQYAGLPNNLGTALTYYYFNGFMNEAVDPEAATPTDEATLNQPDTEDEEQIDETAVEEVDDETDEFIQAAIPAPALTISEAISEATGVPTADLFYIFTGQLRTALYQTTLGAIGRYLVDQSTVTPIDMLMAADQPSTETAQKIANQSPTTELIDKSFFSGLKESIKNNSNYDIWQQIQNEATEQWNFSCDNKQQLAQAAIDKLMNTLLDLPDLYSSGSTTVTSKAGLPLQILVPNKDALSSDIRNKIKQKYPGADGILKKWGVYTAPRGQTQVDIGV